MGVKLSTHSLALYYMTLYMYQPSLTNVYVYTCTNPSLTNDVYTYIHVYACSISYMCPSLSQTCLGSIPAMGTPSRSPPHTPPPSFRTRWSSPPSPSPITPPTSSPSHTHTQWRAGEVEDHMTPPPDPPTSQVGGHMTFM